MSKQMSLLSMFKKRNADDAGEQESDANDAIRSKENDRSESYACDDWIEGENSKPVVESAVSSTSRANLSERRPCEEGSEPSQRKKRKKTSECNADEKLPNMKVSTVKGWGFDYIGFEDDGINVTKVWCDLCRKFPEVGTSVHEGGKKNVGDPKVYITGTCKVKKDSIQKHNLSSMHLNALKKQQGIEMNKVSLQDRPIVKSVVNMEQKNLDKCVKLFDIAYTVAYKELPFTMYPTLIRLEKKHGVDLGETYANRKACATFIDEINGVMVQELKEDIGIRPLYCSIAFDGSTDKAANEKEICSMRFVNKGEVEDKLLSIVHLAEADSATIYSSLVDTLTKYNLSPEENLVAAAADGASVNFGHVNGVLTRLKELSPWLVETHCVAHKFELALKDAFKGTYFSDVIDDTLSKMYSIYHRSGKRLRRLREIGKNAGVSVIRPPRAQGTRWIDHKRKALVAMERNYSVIVDHLNELGATQTTDAAKMNGYLKAIQNDKFVLYMATYRDILDVLAKFSLSMQSQKKSVSDVQLHIESTLAEVQNLGDSVGTNLKKSMEKCESSTSVIKNTVLKDTKVLVQKLEQEISKRFKDFIESDIVGSMKVMDPVNWPDKDNDKYGRQEIQTLAEHFEPILRKNDCVVEKIQSEWSKLKRDVRNNHSDLDCYDLWKTIISKKSDRYPNMIHLVKIVLVMPISTAHIERLFSAVKRTLGDWRHSLNVENVESLVRIKTEGPTAETFDPLSAVNRWRVSGCRIRRPTVRPYGPRTGRMSTGAAVYTSGSESGSSSGSESDV